MKTSLAIALALAAFAAGAFLTGVAATGTADMTAWSMADMMSYCKGIMATP